jgi:hypothetical protein
MRCTDNDVNHVGAGITLLVVDLLTTTGRMVGNILAPCARRSRRYRMPQVSGWQGRRRCSARTQGAV